MNFVQSFKLEKSFSPSNNLYGKVGIKKCLLAQFYTKTFFGHNVPISGLTSLAVMGT